LHSDLAGRFYFATVGNFLRVDWIILLDLESDPISADNHKTVTKLLCFAERGH